MTSKDEGGRDDVEHLLLVAQAYQESELNQSARSPVGAIGVKEEIKRTAK